MKLCIYLIWIEIQSHGLTCYDLESKNFKFIVYFAQSTSAVIYCCHSCIFRGGVCLSIAINIQNLNYIAMYCLKPSETTLIFQSVEIKHYSFLHHVLHVAFISDFHILDVEITHLLAVHDTKRKKYAKINLLFIPHFSIRTAAR